MRYFLDFDRTLFDTESFKRSFVVRPTFLQLLRQFKDVCLEAFEPASKGVKRRVWRKALGTYMSHGRFMFMPQELKDFLYPEVPEFLRQHGQDSTVVTYGVQAFITAKVTNALTGFTLDDIVYTSRKKGPVIRKLSKHEEGPYVFVDDMPFQLASVAKACPYIKVYEIRRDGGAGTGRWPVIHSLDELPEPEVSSQT